MSIALANTNLIVLPDAFTAIAGVPTAPLSIKSFYSEKRITDPSSCCPKGQCYPIPSFFEYRTNTKEVDAL